MKKCEECSKCITLGEGDHLCEVSMELVIINYVPTKEYGQCQLKNNKEDKTCQKSNSQNMCLKDM